MCMTISLYLATIEQDILETFRFLPHSVVFGVGVVTVAAALKNRLLWVQTQNRKKSEAERVESSMSDAKKAHVQTAGADVHCIDTHHVGVRYAGAHYTGTHDTNTHHAGALFLWFLTAVYFAMLLSITLLSREPGSRNGVDLKLFETWGNQRLPDRYFVENILLFLPFGALLPAVVPFLRKWWGCLYAAFATSMMLETIQLLTERGFCQLDDVVTNTCGALLGYLGYCCVKHYWKKCVRQPAESKTQEQE